MTMFAQSSLIYLKENFKLKKILFVLKAEIFLLNVWRLGSYKVDERKGRKGELECMDVILV